MMMKKNGWKRDVMTQKANESNPDLKDLSQRDFLNFGIHELAYIKPVNIQKRSAFAIHAADGTPLSIMETLDMALLAVRQNDLEAVTVH